MKPECPTCKLLRAELETVRQALKDMFDWYVRPGGELYRTRPEFYVQGEKPIIQRAHRALLGSAYTGE